MEAANKVLAVLMLGSIMAAVDSTIVTLAFPSIVEFLGSNFVGTVGIIMSYLVVLAVFTTQFGRAGDIHGRARLFNLGFAIFTVSSLLCGLAPNISFLIAARAAEGVGAALLVANSAAILTDTFPRNRLGRSFGYIAVAWNTGTFLGIILGGTLTTLLGWRYIFLINIPIGLVGVYLGRRYLRDVNRVQVGSDLTGMVLLGVALTTICYSSVDLAASGLTLFNALLLLGGFALIAITLEYERRTKSPMIDLKAFSNRVLRFSLIAAFLQNIAVLAIALLLTTYLQGIRGLSPLYAALLLLPSSIVNIFLAPFTGRMADRFGARIIATAGIACVGVSTALLLTVGLTTPYYVVALAMVISGMGGAMFYPANNSAVMANAAKGSYGVVSGLYRTLQNIGTLGSYILAISVLSLGLPRSVAYQVFIGTTEMLGGLTSSYIQGFHLALEASLVILFVAGAMSYVRGRDVRNSEPPQTSAQSG
jgi:EmrB/QacA subfamily drug resistance transporter